jgi:hypothetical protein
VTFNLPIPSSSKTCSIAFIFFCPIEAGNFIYSIHI